MPTSVKAAASIYERKKKSLYTEKQKSSKVFECVRKCALYIAYAT